MLGPMGAFNAEIIVSERVNHCCWRSARELRKFQPPKRRLNRKIRPDFWMQGNKYNKKKKRTSFDELKNRLVELRVMTVERWKRRREVGGALIPEYGGNRWRVNFGQEGKNR